MIYNNCKLYQVKSKKLLKYILCLNKDLLKQESITTKFRPYIDNSKGKPRLIEPPSEDLKKAQTSIKKQLNNIIVPNNIFSGVKGKSYVENARFHMKNRFLYKIDLTGFFPSISRNVVYSFFLYDLCCSPDVAEILTNLTTIDLEKTDIKNKNEIDSFLKSKKIASKNHLISGAPTSQILSYLVNHHMFDELETFSNKYQITMTVYVDDVTFSSLNPIPNGFRDHVCAIIVKYGYQISKKKVKLYGKNKPKLVTGVIITSDHHLSVKNSLRLKTILKLNELKNNPSSFSTRQQLRGLITAVQQTNNKEFPAIHQFAYQKMESKS